MTRYYVVDCIDKPTINKIVESAVALFSLKGYARVSVKEIAEAAGVNIALISYYFGGKEKLYSYVMEQQLTLFGRQLEVIRQEQQDPLEKIRCFIQTAIEVHKKFPYLNRLLYRELLSPTNCFDEIVKGEAERFHNFLGECIREAIAQGRFRPDLDIYCATVTLFSMIHFTLFTQCLPDTVLTAKDDREEYYLLQSLEIYLHGVQCPGA